MILSYYHTVKPVWRNAIWRPKNYSSSQGIPHRSSGLIHIESRSNINAWTPNGTCLYLFRRVPQYNTLLQWYTAIRDNLVCPLNFLISRLQSKIEAVKDAILRHHEAICAPKSAYEMPSTQPIPPSVVLQSTPDYRISFYSYTRVNVCDFENPKKSI